MACLKCGCHERGESKYTSSRERVYLGLKKYRKLLILVFVVLGLSTFLPINVGKPNFLGSFTLCSFAPVATVALFALALTVHSLVNKRKLLLYGNVFLLIVILGFSVYWVYCAKVPMDSIEINMSNVRFFPQYDHWYADLGKNASRISFDLVVNNPNVQNTWYLWWQRGPDFYIEGKKLEWHTYDILYSDVGVVKARGTRDMNLYVDVIYNLTEVEGGALDSVWMALMSENFTFTMGGILASRSYYGPTSTDYYVVWASKPFSVSYTYHE